ncbi:hemerythrin domain-containing protein [Rhodococcus sp. D2-41]|uniref:hemerythrin domain-containing protein n=1 Tax=Speluncibacter jeojiensis TaxID=2710754 RepID=UPI00240F29A9|nr:hemerythrin domain-containing protein [Rhodococcus sp. D2-41]MDG3012028.1 hemerythrin domain-containing protein [Rhodococcus sp. D2-41]
MADQTLGAALEREHREIDGDVEKFVTAIGAGETRIDALGRAMVSLRRHIYLEEEFLFPPLKAAGMMGPVMVMLKEHGQMWQTMADLDVRLAELDGGDATAVETLCRELVGELQEHNGKEELILYPQADAVLDVEASADLEDFLAGGTMPEGWAATMARRG